MHLRIAEKILLHLYDYRVYEDRYEYPLEITQQGIAERVGISTAHVPRNIKKLIDEDLIYSKKGHVTGKKKRVTVYFLTPKGIMEVKKILNKIESNKVEIDSKTYTIGELRNKLSLPVLDIFEKLENGDIKKILHGEKRVVFKEVDVPLQIFVDRENVLERMLEWYSSGKVLSIVGGRGMGKTTLIERFIQLAKPKENILWFHIYEKRGWESVKEVFRNLFDMESVLEVLRSKPSILIFDNYFDVDDTFVAALNSLIREDLGESKVIVAMRSDTPFYNRFYTLSDVAEGFVTEIKLGGLPYTSVRELLPHIKDSALKHIHRLVKGNPLIIMAIREENIDDIDFLNTDQKHLLRYLSSQKKR